MNKLYVGSGRWADCKAPADAPVLAARRWFVDPLSPPERSPLERLPPISRRQLRSFQPRWMLACFRPDQPQASPAADLASNDHLGLSAHAATYGRRPTPPSMLKASGRKRYA